MTLSPKINEKDLQGFTQSARALLIDAMEEYSSDLIEEANRIESGRNPEGGPVEVTGGMVSDAKLLIRRGLGAPRRSMKSKVMRVAAFVCTLAVGFLYDKEELQNSWYMILFVAVVAAAILLVTITTIKE